MKEALKLFRRKGFDATTMRDIAAAAGMSLGASYYYFGSKEELVHAYYDEVQAEHEARLPAEWPSGMPLAERVRTIFRTKLDIVERDGKFLGALFRFAAEPAHELGVFSPGTAAIRGRAIATYRSAVRGAVPADLEERFAQALWLAHLGLLLHRLHDPTKAGERTRRLADVGAEAAEKLAALVRVQLVRAQLDELLAKL